MKTLYEYIKIFLMIAIMIMIFLIGMLIKNSYVAMKYPSIATRASYNVTVLAGGHIWLYDAGAYDIKAMPGAIIHQNGK